MIHHLPKAWLPHGRALQSYWNGNHDTAISIHMDDGSITRMPIEIYFRKEEELPELERIALQLCKGKILDVGAGAGAHCLILQDKGFDVTGLDISEQGVEVMRENGVTQCICEAFLDYTPNHNYDTLLFLMNGIGIAGSLTGLSTYLKKAANLLSPNGQIILDSSDLRNGEVELDFSQDYFGTFNYQLEFDGQLGATYRWLYVDQEMLISIAKESQLNCEIIYEQEDGSFLARLAKS